MGSAAGFGTTAAGAGLVSAGGVLGGADDAGFVSAGGGLGGATVMGFVSAGGVLGGADDAGFVSADGAATAGGGDVAAIVEFGSLAVGSETGTAGRAPAAALFATAALAVGGKLTLTEGGGAPVTRAARASGDAAAGAGCGRIGGAGCSTSKDKPMPKNAMIVAPAATPRPPSERMAPISRRPDLGPPVKAAAGSGDAWIIGAAGWERGRNVGPRMSLFPLWSKILPDMIPNWQFRRVCAPCVVPRRAVGRIACCRGWRGPPLSFSCNPDGATG